VASLTAHLLEAGDHGRLGFHPGCPVCRQERLSGSLAHEALISRRAQAALATGVLAVATSAPVAAIAQEPDQTQEGVVAPESPGSPQPDGAPQPEDPGFDPGGETDLPFEVGPPEAAPQDDDAEPVETEPMDDPSGRLAPLDDPEAHPPELQADAPVAPPEPAPPVVERPATEPAPAPVEPLDAPPPPVEDDSSDEAEAEAHKRADAKPRQERSESRESPPSIEALLDAEPSAPYVAPSTSPPPSAPAAPPEPAPVPVAEVSDTPAHARFHVVEPGESLWSIAQDLLGPEASTASVARKVAHLWELNEQRIGTGDPDLLMAGTKLRLR
jgi:hypothetical protein